MEHGLCIVLYLYLCCGSVRNPRVVRREPYGPLLCGQLCQVVVGCSQCMYQPTQLTCEVYTGKDKEHHMDGKFIGLTQNLKKPFSRKGCYSGSTIIHSLNRGHQCVASDNPCPAVGYRPSSDLGFCYKRYSGAHNWTAGRARCKQEGGDLISLDTLQKYNIVHDYMATIHPYYKVYRLWVGLKRGQESSYKWLSGSHNNIVWCPGEPHCGGEHCGFLIPRGLGDIQCYEKYEFMCEIPLS